MTKTSVTFPAELLTLFEHTSFCPSDSIRGLPETGTGWNTLRCEYDEGGETEYPTTAMFYDYHEDGRTYQAERAFAEWPGSKDGQFVKAVIDWLQSMTQAKTTGG